MGTNGCLTSSANRSILSLKDQLLIRNISGVMSMKEHFTIRQEIQYRLWDLKAAYGCLMQSLYWLRKGEKNMAKACFADSILIFKAVF